MKKNVLIGIVSVIVLISLVFGLGYLNVFYKNTVGVSDESGNRHIFKQNKSYTEGMVSDLASYKLQLVKEKDQAVRNALIETITTKYANFDITLIEDENLQGFLEQIRNGEIK